MHVWSTFDNRNGVYCYIHVHFFYVKKKEYFDNFALFTFLLIKRPDNENIHKNVFKRLLWYFHGLLKNNFGRIVIFKLWSVTLKIVRNCSFSAPHLRTLQWEILDPVTKGPWYACLFQWETLKIVLRLISSFWGGAR